MTDHGSGHIDRKVAFLKSFLGILGEVIVLGLIAFAFRHIRHLVLMIAPPVYITNSIWLFETALVWVELAFVLASFAIYCLIVIFVPNSLESIYRAFRAFVEEAALSAFLMLIMFGCGAAIGFIGGLGVEPDETAE